MNKSKYPLFKMHIDKESAMQQLGSVFDSGFINEGIEVGKLTQELERYLQTDNLILTNSCTSAITLALHLAGVNHNDEVVSTPMTCVATNSPIVNLGATIKWADIDPKTGMVTPETIKNAITSKTKAVVVVAWAGTPPDLLEIRRLCNYYGLALILDAAHAFGAKFADKQIHEFADFTCYSFQAIKHFTTGDGGALICKSNEKHKRAKAAKWFGLDRDRVKDENGNWKGQQWDVDICQNGYKFNMNNVAAAIGLSQIPHIFNILTTHRQNAAFYDNFFAGRNMVHPVERHVYATSSHWVYTMTINLERSLISRDELLEKLNAEGIMAGVVHIPNDNYTAYLRFKQNNLPGVRKFSELQFSLPCGWWLTYDDIRHISTRVIELTT